MPRPGISLGGDVFEHGKLAHRDALDERVEDSPRTATSSARSTKFDAGRRPEEREDIAAPSNNADAFGIKRGKCRCGRCREFQRKSPKSLACKVCACPSNRHKRKSYFQKPASLSDFTNMKASHQNHYTDREIPQDHVAENTAAQANAQPIRSVDTRKSPHLSSRNKADSLPEQGVAATKAMSSSENGVKSAPGPSSRKTQETTDAHPKTPLSGDQVGHTALSTTSEKSARINGKDAASPREGLTKKRPSDANPSTKQNRVQTKVAPDTTQTGAFDHFATNSTITSSTAASVGVAKPADSDPTTAEPASAASAGLTKSASPVKPTSTTSASVAKPARNDSTRSSKPAGAASASAAKPASAPPASSTKPASAAKRPVKSSTVPLTEETSADKSSAAKSQTTSNDSKRNLASESRQRTDRKKSTTGKEASRENAPTNEDASKETADVSPPKAPPDAGSVKDDADNTKRKAAVEAWRKKVQFALYNTEYRRCGELCDEMLKKMASESLEWRIPVLVQRAETYLRWSEVAETERIRRSRIRCAKLDCAAALEEVGGHRSHLLADTLLGLGLTMQSQVDLLHGHLGNARRKLAKAIDGMRKHPELLVLWGLDYVSVAGVKLQEVSKAGTLQSQAEEALKQNKPLRCLRHIDSLLAVCPISVQGLSLKVDALLKAKRWADAATFCEKVKGELDTKTDRRLLANMIMGEARCAYAHGKVDEAVHLAQSIEDIFMQGESRVSLTLWRRLSEDKAKGNAFFAKGQYSKALDHYSAALARCTSPKFSAILHSNRAATHMARKQYKLALNDCDEALRLDPNYTKAMLRRARAGAQLPDELSFLLRARADYHRVFRRDHTQQATHQQELNELEVRISNLKKAEADARAARQKNARPRPSEKTPERSNPSSSPSGAASAGSKPRPASAKPKSWKERQDEHWREWFSSRGSRPRHTSNASTGKGPGRASKSSTSSSSSSSSSSSRGPRPRTAGSRTWGGGTFGSANVTAWLDSKGRIKNYYQALGLTQGAGIDRVSIKKAFHRLALKHHPDKTQTAPELERRKSETTFKRVAEAYSVLGNDEVREQYDRFFRCIA